MDLANMNLVGGSTKANTDGVAVNTVMAQARLPEDFAQKLDEIRLIKAALQELKDNFSNVILLSYYHC